MTPVPVIGEAAGLRELNETPDEGARSGFLSKLSTNEQLPMRKRVMLVVRAESGSAKVA